MIGIIGAMEIETKGIKNLIEKPAFDNLSSIEFVSGRMHG